MRRATLAIVVAACGGDAAVDESTTVDNFTMVESTGWTDVNTGWTNKPIPQQPDGTFALQFAIKPSGPDPTIDGVIGFANGAADAFTDLGPILRFNPDGRIDARNGSAYQAVTVFPYTLWTEYEVSMGVDLAARRYSAQVREHFGGGNFVPIAQDYAFRTEQAQLSRIDTIAGFIDSPSGMVSWANLIASPDRCDLAAPGWDASPFPAQSGHFRAIVDAAPLSSSSTIDAVVGLSTGAPHAFTDLAAIIRFNPDGMIDARNGGAYYAEQAVPYTIGAQYRFFFEVDVPTHRYTAMVAPIENGIGVNYVRIGTNLAFRTEQAGATSLGFQGVDVDGDGLLSTCSLMAWNY